MLKIFYRLQGTSLFNVELNNIKVVLFNVS